MPTFGNANSLTLTHILETTFGVTPANPVLKRLRVNGESLNPKIGYDESAEINPNYSLADLIPVSQEAGGSIPYDFAKETALDEIFEAVLRGTWTTNVLKGGTVERSFTIEKTMSAGGSNKFQKLTGARYNGFSIEGQVGGRLSGSIEIMASALLNSGTSIIGTGSITAPAGNRVLSMVDMTSFTITGDTTTLIVSRFALSVSNNCRYQPGHGQLASYGIGYGMREVTLSFDAYFETFEQMDKLLSRANNNLTLVLSDGTNSYTIRLPKLRFRNVEANASGNNSDIMQTIEGKALYDPTGGVVTDIMITRAP
jgi:hypothetical protein